MKLKILLSLCVIGFVLAPPLWASDFELTQQPDGIHFKSANQPLAAVLQSISAKSGISFYTRDELSATPITANLQAPDWKTLVSELLKDFSKLEMWNEKISGSTIRIVGLGDYIPAAPVANAVPKAVMTPSQPEKIRPEIPARPRGKFKRPEPPKRAREILPTHPLAKLPSHVFMEPAITNYLLENKVDIPPEYKKEYGLSDGQEEDGRESFMRNRESYPIPNEIYNDPAFDEYLKAVGLPKPPQIPVGFKKIDSSKAMR